MVCVEGRCNPPNGVAEESLNLMQQDNRHDYCGKRERKGRQLGRGVFLGLEVQHGKVVAKG